MAHFVWDMNPEIFKIGVFTARYYATLLGCGFLLSYFLMRHVFRREGFPIKDLASLFPDIIIGAILGSRLGHCLLYEPGLFLMAPWRILYIWEGGLASHGGAVGVILAVWLYCRKHPDQSFSWLSSRIMPSVALTAACIRMGNFINSEILGRPTTLPWGIIFKRVDNIPRHPAMLYEALSYFFLFIFLQARYLRRGRELTSYSQLGIFFVWMFSSRILTELLKENQVAFEQGMFLNMGQLLSLPFLLVGILMLTGHYEKMLPRQWRKKAASAASGAQNVEQNGAGHCQK